MCHYVKAQTKPWIKQNSLCDVTVCFIFVNDRNEIDRVTMRWNTWRVATHHILHVLLNVINLQVYINNMTNAGVYELLRTHSFVKHAN